MASIFLNNLRSERESAAAAYHLFLLDYPKAPEGIFAFFEGRDDSSFYAGFILRVIQESRPYFSYCCGNKAGVLKAHEKIQARGRTAIIAIFFVDKDHSDLLGETQPHSNNIYVTDYYSIENYLVTEAMVRRMFIDLLSFPQSSQDLDELISRFSVSLQSFYDLMIPIMAWILYLRRRQIYPNLSNIKLSRIFRLEDDLQPIIIQGENPPLVQLEQLCGVSTPDTFGADASSVIAELAAIEPKRYLRGKFELWFLVHFFERSIELLNTKLANTGKTRKLRTQVSETTAVEVLGPRAETPTSLQRFLNTNIINKDHQLLHKIEKFIMAFFNMHRQSERIR